MNPVIYRGQPVITTELLAQAYETTTDRIKQNFNRNKDRFEEGKHYFLITGEELRAIKREVSFSSLVIAMNVNQLYLWTERGANRHSKILDTDKAWEQFENLEECYFRAKHSVHTAMPNYELLKCLSGVASFLRVQISVAKAAGKTPNEIAAIDEMYCRSFGLPVPESFAPKMSSQLTLDDIITVNLEAQYTR